MRLGRRALCIGLSRFGQFNDEPATASKDPLPFASQRVEAVSAGLRLLGYESTTANETVLATADELGAAVVSAITSDNGVQVVYVLSHGEQARSGAHVVGADGNWTHATNISAWVAEIEDYPAKQRPCTLFLIDTCYAGDAARLSWLPAAGPDTRAWVIAATESGKLAYEGRFSLAVANVLTRIANGEIDFYPGEHIPFGDVVEHIRREVSRLGGSRQYVTSTPVDGRPAPPFFINRRMPTDARLSRVKQDADATLVPFLDLDVALDAAHFLDRASGHQFGDHLRVGCFSGRVHELRTLAAWLNGTMVGSLRVITGEAGSGKSALLGILVCAAHPQLRAATEGLWNTTGEGCVPNANPDLAAIHLRERSLSQVLAALVRQLNLRISQSDIDPGILIEAIVHRAQQPVIIIDALDEATTQHTILTQLLIPLAHAKRIDGSSACRLIVGMRPWVQFQELRALAIEQDGLIDLDQIPVDRLRDELEDYINDLLSLISYPLTSRRALKRNIAQALTAPDRKRGGEFLAAALYSNWLAGRNPDGVSAQQAADLARSTPRNVPDILDLELGTRADEVWLRPVLSAIAYAHGAGMPASVIIRLAPQFRRGGHPAELTSPEFDHVLMKVRFYLRSSPDIDGTTLYRLFHQSLVDHLRTEGTDLSSLLDRLLITAPISDNGQRQWDAAEPYVRRHAMQHAIDAGRLDELVHFDPRELESAFNTTVTQQGRLAVAVYQQSLDWYRAADIASRRDLLGFNAARYGALELAKRMARMPGLPDRVWWPRWSTGGELRVPHIAKMTGHTGEIYTLACTNIEGRPVAVTCGVDATVQVWDLTSWRLRGNPLMGHIGTVTAVACTILEGAPVAVTGGVDGTVRVWDLTSGQPHGEPLTGHAATVNGVVCTTLRGRPIAVTCADDDTLLVWDLTVGRQRDKPLISHADEITAMNGGLLAGKPVALTGAADGTIRVWDLASGESTAKKLTGHTDVVNVIALTTLGQHTVAISGASDGTLRAWDLDSDSSSRELLTDPTYYVYAAACTALQGQPVAVTGDSSGRVQVVNLVTGHPRGESFMGESDNPVFALGCARLADGPVAVTGGADGALRVWDLTSKQLPGMPLNGHTGEVNTLACTIVDGRRMAVTGADDGTIRIWDLASGHPHGEPISIHDDANYGHAVRVQAVTCATIEGRPVALTGASDGSVSLWDLVSGLRIGSPICGAATEGREREEWRPELNLVACAWLGGRLVAVTGWAGAVTVRDAEYGWPYHASLLGHAGWVSALACTMLKRRPVAVMGGFDRTVQVWDLASARMRGRPLVGHTGWVRAVACMMLDGNPIAVTGADDHTIHIWDLASGKRYGHPLIGHTDAVQAVACARLSTGPVIVTGGLDRMICVWDLYSQRKLTSIAVPDRVKGLAVTPEGEIVVAFGSEVCVIERLGER